MKEKLEKEYQLNHQKIKELSTKITILNINSIELKMMIILIVTITVFTGMTINIEKSLSLFQNLVNLNVISTSIIPSLYLITPIVIGIMVEKIIEKTFKFKKKLRLFTKAKLEGERLEEAIRYTVELEKLKNHNKVIEKKIREITI